MAEHASVHLFLSLLFALAFCSSGTIVGLSYDAREHHGTSSSAETSSLFLKHNQVSPSQIRVIVQDLLILDNLTNSSIFVDLFINETLAQNLIKRQPSAVSWLKTQLTTFPPHANIKSIIVSSSTHSIPKLLSSLRSIHSLLRSFRLEDQISVSVSFPLSFLENLNGEQRRDQLVVLNFIKKLKAFVIVEAMDDDFITGDFFLNSVIQKTKSAAAVLPCNEVSRILKIKTSAIPSTSEFSEFADKILRSLKNKIPVGKEFSGLLVEVSPPKEEQIFRSSHRELLDDISNKTTRYDELYPPSTTFPPYNNPSPTIVTVPPTNPVTITPNSPTNPAVTVPVSPNNPVPLPYTNPMNSPVPITNPVTTPGTAVPGTLPVTNPVTTYPAPSTGVPVTTPVTNPVAPPAVTGGTPATTGGTPAVSGQSWCVARTGALETALQAALDYACGIGGVDCSAIQEGASCYDPNTLENHASYAFNSYFQKNPSPTSCDFGGTAIVTSTNPSTGTCIFQTSSSSSSSLGTPTPNAASSSGATVPGYGSPPTVVNTGDPATGSSSSSSSSSVFDGSPPGLNSTSKATSSQPFLCCIILVMSMVMGRFNLDV